MNISEPVDNIFHLHYNDQLELTSTFLRFQEYYESPEFRGKIFSLEEYKEWYFKNSKKGKETGEFTYYSDWKGFNIPSYVLTPFYEGKFNPLDEQEKSFLKLFEDKLDRDFYVIGTFGENSSSTLRHEIAHGLYFTNEDYRVVAKNLISDIPIEARETVERYLRNSAGYHEEVIEDEVHAHVFASLEKLAKKEIDIEPLKVHSDKLELNFKRYVNGF